MKYTCIQRGNFLAESDSFDNIIELARTYAEKTQIPTLIIRNFMFENERTENNIPDCWVVSPKGFFSVGINRATYLGVN